MTEGKLPESRGGYLKASGHDGSHCPNVGTGLPDQRSIIKFVNFEENIVHLEQLIHDVLSVDPLEDVSLLDDVVQVRLHELEHQVEVLVVGRSMDIQELDDVWVASKLFQKDNFPANRSSLKRRSKKLRPHLNVR